MTTYTEPSRPLDAVLYEDEPLSRESITIPNGTAAFTAGMVLGRTLVSGSATAVAYGTNSGAGAMGTITVGASAKIGTYYLTVVEPGSGVGDFIVTDPEGIVIGKGAVASAFNQGGLSFTLADGTPDFAAGDGFAIVVTGTVKYVPYDDGNSDGSNVARAVALYDCDASGAEAKVSAIVRHAVLDYNGLAWHASADATSKAKAITDLAKTGVILRS